MKLNLYLFIALFFLFTSAPKTHADEVSKLGVHILHPSELESAKELIAAEGTDQWQYVTVPFTLDDTYRLKEWQEFFNQAREKKVIPLVRLTTRFENGAWQVPSQREAVRLLTALGMLQWPTEQRHIIVFNEVNHAKEWGGQIDAAQYAKTLAFVSSWARSENKNFVIMPAAMDLAAPNGKDTKEAFTYLQEMHEYNPEIFSYIDVWNSHSYPNPAFSAAPQRTGKNTLRGYEYELAFVKEKTQKDFDVYITETGWEDNRATSRSLTAYYTYAVDNIWSDARVKAVTPFVLKGSPGPFAGFSFLTGDNKPTRQYVAFKQAIESLAQKDRLVSDAGN